MLGSSSFHQLCVCSECCDVKLFSNGLLRPLEKSLTLFLKVMMTGQKRNVMGLVLIQLFRTCVMLNSLLNPLIYCLRQNEMRKFVLRVPCRQAVEPAMN